MLKLKFTEDTKSFIIYDDSDNRKIAVVAEFMDALTIIHAVNKVTSEYKKQTEDALT